MLAPMRAEGLRAGNSRAQLVPSQVQVSSRSVSPLAPPNNTAVPAVGSQAILDWPRRGGFTLGCCSAQLVLSQVQVLPSPNSTAPRLAGSHAMLASLNLGGVAGGTSVHAPAG